MSESIVIGVWCGGGSELLANVQGETPLLLFTLRRLKELGWKLHALVPWTSRLDHMEKEVRGWGYPVRRCSEDKRVAMRDMVAHHMAAYGCLVDGTCAVIDAAELRLAVARIDAAGDGRYVSSRLNARTALEWLSIDDLDAWPEPMDRLAAARFFDGKPGTAQARELKATAAEQRPITG